MNKIFKVKNGLSPELMFSRLSKNHSHYEETRISGQRGFIQQNMAQTHTLTLRINYAVLFQINKAITSLAGFKAKIRTWIPENCPSRLCMTFIHQIGFL